MAMNGKTILEKAFSELFVDQIIDLIDGMDDGDFRDISELGCAGLYHGFDTPYFSI